jgi:hypothetical protein
MGLSEQCLEATGIASHLLNSRTPHELGARPPSPGAAQQRSTDGPALFQMAILADTTSKPSMPPTSHVAAVERVRECCCVDRRFSAISLGFFPSCASISVDTVGLADASVCCCGSAFTVTVCTGAMNLYPRRDSVSTNLGVPALSSSASRRRRTAALSAWSKSTNVSLGQSFSRISLRVTSWPGHSSNLASTRNGCS